MEITVDDLKISYRIFGEGEETAVLLQGWGTTYSIYESIANILSEKMRVVFFDFPGFGDSEEPKEAWGVSEFSDFFLDLMKALDIKHATLFGHSFGGRVIIKLSSNKCHYFAPERADEVPDFSIDRIVLIDAAGIKAPLSKEQQKKIKRYKRLKKFYSNKLVYALFQKQIDAWKSHQGSEDYRNASPMMRQCMVKAINEDLTKYLPFVTEEVLLVWGENDTATPLKDGQLMEKEMPDAGLAFIHNAGHFSFLDQPVIFENIMRSYFKM